MSRCLAPFALLVPALALAQGPTSIEEVETEPLAQRADVTSRNLGLAADPIIR